MHMTLTKMNALACSSVCAAMLFLSATTAGAEATMYERFGGKEGVAKIVDDFIGFVAADTRINFQFGKTDIAHLKAMLNDLLCAATGGGCQYGGRDMKSTHAGMGITNAQFNALAEDMQLAWEKNNVPYRLQNRLLALLAPMQHDIVTR
jgi:hemoglobin